MNLDGRRIAIVGSLVALAAAIVTVVALAADGGDAGPSVSLSAPVPEASPATTTPGASYCDRARAALMYEGTDLAERVALLDRVVDAAPGEVASTVRSVRAARPGTPRYTRAKNLWDYYNKTHCCQCIGAGRAPEISALTPEQRALVEAGKSISKR